LDLSWNYLGRRTGAELAEALRAIPASVTALDLSWNFLGNKTGAELVAVFQAIPATVQCINIEGNDIFTQENRSFEDRNILFNALRGLDKERDIYDGHKDFSAAMLALLSMRNEEKICTDAAGNILSFLSFNVERYRLLEIANQRMERAISLHNIIKTFKDKGGSVSNLYSGLLTFGKKEVLSELRKYRSDEKNENYKPANDTLMRYFF
jgi:hypothetical protein